MKRCESMNLTAKYFVWNVLPNCLWSQKLVLNSDFLIEIKILPNLSDGVALKDCLQAINWI